MERDAHNVVEIVAKKFFSLLGHLERNNTHRYRYRFPQRRQGQRAGRASPRHPHSREVQMHGVHGGLGFVPLHAVRCSCARCSAAMASAVQGAVLRTVLVVLGARFQRPIRTVPVLLFVGVRHQPLEVVELHQRLAVVGAGRRRGAPRPHGLSGAAAPQCEPQLHQQRLLRRDLQATGGRLSGRVEVQGHKNKPKEKFHTHSMMFTLIGEFIKYSIQ